LNYDSDTKSINRSYPFDLDNKDSSLDTITAIVKLAIEGSSIPLRSESSLRQDAVAGYSSLPDGASGVYAPGWDVSKDFSQGIEHLSTYGLGSPFPEDAKLCAALSSFWPSASPDSGRSFMWLDPATKSRFIRPTVSPLSDNEIGIDGDMGWDGTHGPKLTEIDGRKFIEFAKAEYIDYVENMMANDFSPALTAQIDIIEYQSRIKVIAQVYYKLGILISDRVVKKLPLISFNKVSENTLELVEAQNKTSTMLEPDVYRVVIVDGKIKENKIEDLDKKILFEINESYVFFVGLSETILYKHNNDSWVVL